MILHRLVLVLPAALLVAGCATKKPPATGPQSAPSALEAARAAVRDAQDAHSGQQAPEAYSRALESLRQAESATGPAAREAAIRAEGFARLAIAQANCGTSTSATTVDDGAVLERTQAELRQVREENRRLEERTGLLQHALEQTETDLIRSKARLRGLETKAEAASAIAEARILTRRLNARSTAAALCRDALAKADKQLASGNYGAAASFALRAQETASRALAAPSRP